VTLRRAAVLSLGAVCAIASAASPRADVSARSTDPQAAAPPAPAATPLRFDATTDLVIVDVAVVDSRGRAIRGLTAPDFEVFEDGKRRDIVSFAAYDVNAAPPGPGTLAAPNLTPDEKPAAVVAKPPATILIVDEAHTPPEQTGRLTRALDQILDRLSNDRGVLGFVAPMGKIRIAARLPAGAAELKPIAAKVRGMRPPDQARVPITDVEAIEIESGRDDVRDKVAARLIALGTDPLVASAEASIRAREIEHSVRVRRADLMETLRWALNWLRPFGGRKSIILVSGGFANDPADAEFARIVNQALALNARIHFVDLRGLPGAALQQSVEAPILMSPDIGDSPFAFTNASAGASRVALDTGGLDIRYRQDIAKSIDLAMETTRVYYLLGYIPSADTKKGFRKIKVEVKRRDVDVMARRGYYVN
jgi:VWFA-related protein